MKLIKLTDDHYVIIDNEGKLINWDFDTAYAKELIGEVNVKEKARECFKSILPNQKKELEWNGFIKGYNQALEDNKEKKYTKEDVIRIVEKSRETGLTAEYLLLSLQPKTEWEVEIMDGKLKLK